jgi:alpha-beta hydrolase superfamily lysophospholipase
LLLIAGGKDHTVPESMTRSTLKQYRHSTAVTELEEFPDRGHTLTVDRGWREVAETVLAWLKKKSL